MELATTRFGRLHIEPADLIHFPRGLRGLEDCLDWVLLADTANDSLGWLQSTSRGEVALAVVSPGRFVPRHEVRVLRRELASLGLEGVEQPLVLAIVGKNERGVTLNLKAPLIIDLDQRQGHQVVAVGDQPMQYQLGRDSSPCKKVA